MNYQQKYFQPYHKLVRNNIPPQRQQPPHFHRKKSSHALNKSSHNKSYRQLHQPVWEHLYAEGLKSRQKLMTEQEHKQHKIDVECTFKPEINKSAKYLIHSNSTFLERNQVWHQNKMQRIIKQKQDQVHKKLRQCSFTPEVNRRQKAASRIKGQSQYQNEGNRSRGIHIPKSPIKKNPFKEKSPTKNSVIPKPIKQKMMELNKIRQLIRCQLKKIEI